MGRVIVGVDPHKKSVTIEAVDADGQVLATGRFDTTSDGYRLMLKYVGDQWRDRRWAVEGANGMGRPLAQRLLAQGETVLDVPAKLAARVRVFDTGNARKTDATDAHAVAMVALRTPGLNKLTYDEELVALRLLADRRDELAHLRVQTVNRLQPAADRADPRWREAGSLGAAGQAVARHGEAQNPDRQDDPPDGGRGDRRPGRRGRQAQGDQEGAPCRGAGARVTLDGPVRGRPGRSRQDPGRRR
jgi:transposase